jgi:uncharacterized protein (TIGR00251 family)
LDGADPSLNIRKTATGVVMPVRLTPKSGRDEIAGLEDFGGDTVLKARVRAVPEDGRANTALEKLIAKWLGLPPSAVKVAHGGKSRLKQIAIDGDPATLPGLISERLAAL